MCVASSASPPSRALVSSHPTLLPSYACQIYYHGEPISVNVHVTNNTNKTVKKIKISGTPGRGPAQGGGQEGLLPRIGGSRRLSPPSRTAL